MNRMSIAATTHPPHAQAAAFRPRPMSAHGIRRSPAASFDTASMLADLASAVVTEHAALPSVFPAGEARPNLGTFPVTFNRRMRRGLRLVKEKGGSKRRTTRPLGASRRTTSVGRVSESRLGGFQQPTFTAIPSSLLFGPPTDIAMGWDGTLWAIDASGAPHVFDPGAQQWNPFGAGIDAACQIGSTAYWFRQGQYVTADSGGSVSAPLPIATNWPALPDSFKLGVKGAANVNGVLYLFNGGAYLAADGSVPRTMLTDLAGWPQTQHWVQGVVDAVYSDGSVNLSLFRGAEYITVDFSSKTVAAGPAPIANFPVWKSQIPLDWAASGIDAAFLQGSETVVYKGPALVTLSANGSNTPTPQYIAAANRDWPAVWHPQLQHAPSGRLGNLWVATRAGGVVMHDGEQWNARPSAGAAASVSTGADGSAYVCAAASPSLSQWNAASAQWQLVATASSNLEQVAVGDAAHVWVRDCNNGVHSFDATHRVLKSVPLVGAPTHMAANSDGTLWHCTAGDTNAYCFISEGSTAPAAIPINPGIVSSVQKVSSTGFGTAHCLAQQSDGSMGVYRYESPYVFKTAQSYYASWHASNQIAQGLGNLYIVSLDTTIPSSVVVALDAHTGQEVARTPQPMGGDVIYRGVAFDPLNELVYATVSPIDVSSAHTGALIALDARTLEQKWSFSTSGGADSAPVVSGPNLCFGDRTSTIYMFDTRAALAQGISGQTPTPTWRWSVPAAQSWSNSPNRRVAAPLLANGQVYAAVWYFSAETAQVPTPTHYLYLAQCKTQDGSGPHVTPLHSTTLPAVIIDQALTPPVQMQGNFEGTLAPGLVVNAADAIVLADPSGKLTAGTYTLPNQANNQVYTGLVVDPASALANGNPALWFADKTATLSALGNDLTPLHTYKASQRVGPYVSTTPILYKDVTGALTVVYGLVDTQNVAGYLYGLDPASSAIMSVPTGLTQITTLTQDHTNGVVYAAGADANPSGNPANQIAQVFGIRVDEWPQTLRDFISDSQLMTDYDDSTPGQPLARYQTHVTVVDNQKTPQPHAALKIWADQPNTAITIDGQPYTVGPGDADFAQVKTGIDGALAVASNAADYFASPLRLWASFMDPYERIVVYPDQEFHARVTTAHANVNDTDPDKINLMTATAYSGKPLFTDDEKQANQPQQIATSIQQVSQGIGVKGSNNPAAAAFDRVMRRASPLRMSTRRTTAALPPNNYFAYGDLAGAAHFFTNIPATRPMAIEQPVGAALWIADPRDPNPPSNPYPAFVPLSPAEARDAIDALPGQSWNPEVDLPPSARGSGRAGNIFTDFWNWLKSAVTTITHIVVSVAEDVMVGIAYVVDNVAKVFKAVLKILDDVFPFLGSFFKMLEKAIDDVVEALSVLLDFGEILQTQKWLVGQVNAQVSNLLANIDTHITNNVDTFFKQGETAIKGFFDQLRQSLQTSSPNAGLKDMQGMGATPHSMFTVGPAGGSGASSHATQCAWPLHKLKSGLPAATLASSSTGGKRSRVGDGDPLTDFFNTFLARLTGDGDLASSFAQFQSDFTNLFHATSAEAFFSTLLVNVIDAVETLLVGALTIGNAFFDGMIKVVEDLISGVMSVLNAEIQIPVLTGLYQSLTGESLTILNLILLVGAIPVTILYKVVTGRFPSQDVGAALGAVGYSPVAAKVLGVMSGLVTLVAGIVNGVSDAAGSDGDTLMSRISAGLGVVGAACTFPLISSDTPSQQDWLLYGMGLMVLAWCGLTAILNAPGQPSSWIYSLCNLGLFAATINAFVSDGKFDPLSDVSFVGGILGAVVGICNPIKLGPDPAPAVVGIADVVAGLVCGGIEAGDAVLQNVPSLTNPAGSAISMRPV